MQINIKKHSACALIILASLLVFTYYWHAIAPKSIATKVLNGFENSFYNERIEKAKTYLIASSRSYRNFELYGPMYKRSFLLFEKGCTVNKAERISINFDRSESDKFIWVSFSKVAKKDNKKREYFEAFLTVENGEWKIDQYSFPDYIDYE